TYVFRYTMYLLLGVSLFPYTTLFRSYSSSGSSWLRSAGAAGGVHGCGISAVEGATLWLVMADPSGECFDNSTYLVFWVWNGSGTYSKFCNQLVLIVVDSDVIDSGAAIFGSAVANCSEFGTQSW